MWHTTIDINVTHSTHDDVIRWKHFPRYWPVTGEFPHKGQWRGALMFSDVFLCFDLRLNKRLSKQSWEQWFETLSRPLWRYRNVIEETLYHNDLNNSHHMFLNHITRVSNHGYRLNICDHAVKNHNPYYLSIFSHTELHIRCIRKKNNRFLRFITFYMKHSLPFLDINASSVTARYRGY